MVRSGAGLLTRYFGIVCKYGMELMVVLYPVLRRIDLQIAFLLLSQLLVA
jgi:hypothetical protein